MLGTQHLSAAVSAAVSAAEIVLAERERIPREAVAQKRKQRAWSAEEDSLLRQLVRQKGLAGRAWPAWTAGASVQRLC